MRAATVCGVADQRRAGAAAHQADAGPQVGADLELVAAGRRAARHAALADRIHRAQSLPAPRRWSRRRRADQLVGGAPGLVLGLAHDHVQADAEATACGRACAARCAHVGDLLRDLRRRLAPGQVGVDLLGRDLVPASDEPPKYSGGYGCLHRRIQQLAALDAGGACRRSRPVSPASRSRQMRRNSRVTS